MSFHTCDICGAMVPYARARFHGRYHQHHGHDFFWAHPGAETEPRPVPMFTRVLAAVVAFGGTGAILGAAFAGLPGAATGALCGALFGVGAGIGRPNNEGTKP